MQITRKLLVILVVAVSVVHSVKVIYTFNENHLKIQSKFHLNVDDKLHHGGIIVVPDEKIKCKGSRTPDHGGSCRKIAQF